MPAENLLDDAINNWGLNKGKHISFFNTESELRLMQKCGFVEYLRGTPQSFVGKLNEIANDQ